jgi:hypothetical protein
MLATSKLQLRARFLARITQLIKQRFPQVLLQFLVILYRLTLLFQVTLQIMLIQIFTHLPSHSRMRYQMLVTFKLIYHHKLFYDQVPQ